MYYFKSKMRFFLLCSCLLHKKRDEKAITCVLRLSVLPKNKFTQEMLLPFNPEFFVFPLRTNIFKMKMY